MTKVLGVLLSLTILLAVYLYQVMKELKDQLIYEQMLRHEHLSQIAHWMSMVHAFANYQSDKERSQESAKDAKIKRITADTQIYKSLNHKRHRAGPGRSPNT